MIKRLLLLCFLAAVFTPQAKASLSFTYVSEGGAGAMSGNDCMNARAASFFNVGANWGAGINQIGPGTTVHVCGTINGAAGTEGFIFQGSGSAGMSITLLFETNAAMTSPAWGVNDGTNPTGGAITANGLSYIIIDGGSNGIIRNTLNGTPGGACTGGPCSQRIRSAGVVINDTSHVTVRNLAINNLYVRTPCSADTADPQSFGVLSNQAGGSAVTDVNILNNVIPAARQGIGVVYGSAGGGVSQVEIAYNTLTREAPGIVFASRGTGVTLTNALIHDNEVSEVYYWWDVLDGNHLNGMHFFAAQAGASITGLQIYNNYVHGDFGGSHCGSAGHETSHIYVEGTGGGTITGTRLFNNRTVSEFAGDYPSGGWLGLGQGTTYYANNNVIGSTVGGTAGDGIQGFDNGNAIGNIFLGMDHALYQNGSGVISSWNYNLAYGVQNGYRLGNNVYNFASWQLLGWDVNGKDGQNPLLVNFVPQAGSPAILSSHNLTSQGIIAQNFDAAGVARPVAPTLWDIGAYQASSAPPVPPASRPRINNSSLPNGIVGTPYNVAFTATGGSPPYTWSGSGFPQGLSISASGVLSGTPNQSGTFSASVTARDAANFDNVILPLAITSPPPATPTGYTKCATELGTCSFLGVRNIAYGAYGAYFYKDLTGGTACTNTVFGDPIPGVTKNCYTKDGVVITPAPPPVVTARTWTNTCTVVTKSDNSVPTMSCTALK